jgi:ATP-dependent protease HslVU (ClpYQ) peptidase subunit
LTVITYSKGTLASDSYVTTGSGHIDGNVRKIIKTDEGHLVGAAGDLSQVSEFLDIFEDLKLGEIEESASELFSELDEIEGILVTKKKVLVFVSGYFNNIGADFYALGNGAPVAKGAMEMGASPERAVEIASKYTLGCGGPIQVVKL